MILKNRFPENGLFGFKILNSFQSILSAYTLLLAEFFLTPYFVLDGLHYIAGQAFIILINSSILILLFNSCIRSSKIDFYFLFLAIQLIIYFPFSIRKIFFILSSFN